MSSDKKDYTKLEDFTEDTDYSQFFTDLTDDDIGNESSSEDNTSDTVYEDDIFDDVLIGEEKSFRKAKKHKNTNAGKRNKKTASGKKSADRTTSVLIVSIMLVGVCLLGIAISGIFVTVEKMKKNQEQPVNADSQIVQDADNQQNISPGTQPQQPQLNNEQNNTTAPITPIEPENGAASVPKSDEEWLAFFNTAVNKLKTDGPSFTKEKQTVTSDIQLSNPLAQAYISSVKDKYLSDETETTNISKGDVSSAVQNVSPDGASYVSALSMSDIKSITYGADANGNYVIRIDMNNVTSPTLADSFGKIFQFMLVDDVMNTYAPNIGATVDRANVSLQYFDCYATATVAPDGKLISYQTYVGAHMILKSAKISVVTTDLDATLISNTIYKNIVW